MRRVGQPPRAKSAASVQCASRVAVYPQTMSNMSWKPSVRSGELAAVLDACAGRIDVLSLDCFDTLLWRRTATPVDVFYALQHSPTFKRLGLNPMLRARAEAHARSERQLRDGKTEVRLVNIYRASFPALSDAELQALQTEELDAEKQACFGFPPVMELIRRARASGTAVVIASDTYFTEPQLRELLSAALPADVYDSISRVFCSCEFGRSKSQGLLRLVREELRVKPERVLHIGDNLVADFEAAGGAGMLRVQLEHQDPVVEEILRGNASTTSLLMPEVRHRRAMPSPFHPVLACQPAERGPASLLGRAGIGPLLYAFGRFLLEEMDELRRQGKRPRALFLMRDAYLPQQVCAAMAGQDVGHAVAISRFAAYAASFRSREDVQRYLTRSAGNGKYEAMARQLLLPEKLAATLVEKATSTRKGPEEFCRLALQDKTVTAIVEASARYRARLFEYLRRHAGLEQGETLVMVDLGYEGTAQRELQPVFEDELGVEVQGRYMLVVRTPGWESSRRGLLDPALCDDRTLMTLVPYIALVEDLCTSDEGSVLDYTEAGEPILAERVLKDEQYERITPVQSECIEFCRQVDAFFTAVGSRPSIEDLRINAVGVLGRLLFSPSEPEIAYLEGFRLDMNMATLDSFALFDRAAGLQGLRRRGLFFMEHNHRSLRMNYPIEVRSAGLELAVTLLAQHRYGLSFSQTDFSLRREPIEVMAVRGDESVSASFDAIPTHDGFFSVVVPVGSCDLNVGLLLGARYSWLELEAVELIKAKNLLTDEESLATVDVLPLVTFEGMAARARRLFECDSSGFLLVQPSKCIRSADENYVCRVVFRPLESRDEALAAAVPADVDAANDAARHSA